MIQVVHLNTLDDLMAEAEGATIYVNHALRTKLSTNSSGMPKRQDIFTAFARAIRENIVFSYTGLVFYTSGYTLRGFDEGAAEDRARLQAEVEAAAEQMVRYGEKYGAVMRRGNVDLQGVEPIEGYRWTGGE